MERNINAAAISALAYADSLLVNAYKEYERGVEQDINIFEALQQGVEAEARNDGKIDRIRLLDIISSGVYGKIVDRFPEMDDLNLFMGDVIKKISFENYRLITIHNLVHSAMQAILDTLSYDYR